MPTEDQSNDEVVDDSVTGTAKIDPRHYRPVEGNPDRLAAFKYALAGLIYMFRREQSIKALSVATVVILGLLIWLDVSINSAALVLLSVGLVWMGEFFNSAVEAVVDLATDEIHPMAKVAKDVAASGVMVGVIVMVLVVLLILGPPLIERIG